VWNLIYLFIKALQHKCWRSVGYQVLQPAKDGKLGQYVWKVADRRKNLWCSRTASNQPRTCSHLMHVAAFIGELQHYKNFKLPYLSIGKWAISPFLSDQVIYVYILLFKHTLCSFILKVSGLKAYWYTGCVFTRFLNHISWYLMYQYSLTSYQYDNTGLKWYNKQCIDTHRILLHLFM